MSTPSTTLSFSSAGSTLFTEQEVRHLMRVEFDRAVRYGYPIACLMIGVDHLKSLHAVHGTEACQRIHDCVLDLMRSETRTSDFLGCLVDEKLLAVFPHTTPQDAKILSDRLLDGARVLKLRVNGISLRTSLSIGLAHNGGNQSMAFETLVRVAEEGMVVADVGGGDRMIETELYQLYEGQLERQLAEGQSQPEGAVQARLSELAETGSSVEEAAVTLAEEIVHKALKRLEEERERGGAALALEQERLKRQELELSLEQQERTLNSKWKSQLDRTIESEQETASREGDYQREIELLQRRVAKLSKSLEVTEGELNRVSTMKGADRGLSSVYREVQGLSAADDQFDAKQGLMTSIFEANIELRHARSA